MNGLTIGDLHKTIEVQDFEPCVDNLVESVYSLVAELAESDEKYIVKEFSEFLDEATNDFYAELRDILDKAD